MWNNTYGCVEHYRCDTELCLLSTLPQAHNIIIDSGIIVPGRYREVVYGPNATDIFFTLWKIYNCLSVKGLIKNGNSHISKSIYKITSLIHPANMVFWIMGNTKKRPSKQKWKKREYHVQNIEYVEQQDVKTYCTTNQFPERSGPFST